MEFVLTKKVKLTEKEQNVIEMLKKQIAEVEEKINDLKQEGEIFYQAQIISRYGLVNRLKGVIWYFVAQAFSRMSAEEIEKEFKDKLEEEKEKTITSYEQKVKKENKEYEAKIKKLQESEEYKKIYINDEDCKILEGLIHLYIPFYLDEKKIWQYKENNQSRIATPVDIIMFLLEHSELTEQVDVTEDLKKIINIYNTVKERSNYKKEEFKTTLENSELLMNLIKNQEITPNLIYIYWGKQVERATKKLKLVQDIAIIDRYRQKRIYIYIVNKNKEFRKNKFDMEESYQRALEYFASEKNNRLKNLKDPKTKKEYIENLLMQEIGRQSTWNAFMYELFPEYLKMVMQASSLEKMIRYFEIEKEIIDLEYAYDEESKQYRGDWITIQNKISPIINEMKEEVSEYEKQKNEYAEWYKKVEEQEALEKKLSQVKADIEDMGEVHFWTPKRKKQKLVQKNEEITRLQEEIAELSKIISVEKKYSTIQENFGKRAYEVAEPLLHYLNAISEERPKFYRKYFKEARKEIHDIEYHGYIYGYVGVAFPKNPVENLKAFEEKAKKIAIQLNKDVFFEEEKLREEQKIYQLPFIDLICKIYGLYEINKEPKEKREIFEQIMQTISRLEKGLNFMVQTEKIEQEEMNVLADTYSCIDFTGSEETVVSKR